MNFSYKTPKENEIAKSDEEKLGEVELVNSENTDQNDYIEEKEEEIEEIDEVSNYFINSRIERENIYSQSLETYEKLLNNNSISSEQKSIAINEISKITNQKKSIMIAENLIKNKGFEDALIMLNDNSTSIIIRSEGLSNENIAQIQNIVSRELGIDISKINISNKN